MIRSCGLSVFLLLLFSVASLTAQQTTTSIRGNWGDVPSSTDEVDDVYMVLLYEATTGGLLQKQVLSEKGTFTFHDVPLGSYRIDIQRGEGVVARSFVYVKSAQPIVVDVEKENALLMDEVVVTSPRYADRKKTATSTIFTSSEIASLPTVSPEKRMESILMNTPGVVPDEDGRFHIRGEDAQLQYVIDGIPVTANMTRIYGSLFDTRLVSSMEIQTGALDAEYGVATSGVVLVNTRSGFDAPSFLRASGSYGSFNTVSGSLQGGGVIGGNLSGMVSAGFSSSDRYLDPISGFDPIHDRGEGRHLFVKADWNGSEDLDLSALFSMNRT
ncbi:MAG: TonB-dependent receptor plug domain-containing protein, partial [Candidatus Kapaibacterium sp.]